MARSCRSIRVLAVLALMAASTGAVVASGTASAVVTPLQIGVDHPGPSGHNYEYKDFFPRGDTASPVHVGQGSVVQFNWPQTTDGFHTATLLGATTDPATIWTNTPVSVADPDDAGGQLQFNPAIGAPTLPPPGSGAPNACGDVATPCPFDGTADLNSGANVSNGTNSFVVQFGRNITPGTVVHYACLIHPGMAASLTVVDPTDPSVTTQPQADTESAAQVTADTAEAAAAETAASVVQSTTNADGTHTFSASAGTETAHAAVLEMLPSPLPVSAGDKIDWHMTNAMAEIHTVTFIDDPKYEPLPQFCEANPTDTAFDPTQAGPPCGDPTKFEVHFNPAPGGGTTITSTSTSASSGILFPPGPPLPHDYTFNFPTAGSFPYFCHIHFNGMKGSVNVLAVSVAATPAAATPGFTG